MYRTHAKDNGRGERTAARDVPEVCMKTQLRQRQAAGGSLQSALSTKMALDKWTIHLARDDVVILVQTIDWAGADKAE